MKHRILIITAAILATAIIPLHAEPPLERDLKQLQEQREKALAAAAEPVNRRYLAALEALQRRATQTNDLETAIKIKEELQKLGAAAPAANDTSGVTVESLTNRLIGTKWIWFGKETLTLLADGKAQWSSGRDPWPWKVTSAGRRVIEGENVVKKNKFTITFDRDLKTGTIAGQDGNPRQTRNITNES